MVSSASTNNSDYKQSSLKRKSHHIWPPLFVDAGKKIAKTTCNLLFGKDGGAKKSSKHDDRKDSIDVSNNKASVDNDDVVDLTLSDDSDANTKNERSDGRNVEAKKGYDGKSNYSGQPDHNTRFIIKNEAELLAANSQEPVSPDAVVDLTIDEESSKFDDDGEKIKSNGAVSPDAVSDEAEGPTVGEEDADVVELFSMFKQGGHHNVECSICKAGDGGE